MANSAVNSGVHGSSGIEFQKFCALYVLLENFNDIKNKKYFICLEHHDDILFCFLNTQNELEKVNAYQAKKSATEWPMGEDFFSILAKLIQVGMDLHNDQHIKHSSYFHLLKFATNNSITLHCGTKPIKNRKKKQINSIDPDINFASLDTVIQNKLLAALKSKGVTTQAQLNELNKLGFLYLDLPQTTKKQKETIVGQFATLFSNTVKDPSAAVDALLLIFRSVENELNKGNIAKLMDVSKRVTSDTINETLGIITSKVKAYELWRTRGTDLANELQIKVFNQKNFLLQFQNSFDFFKDLTQLEHQKIRKFVKTNRHNWEHHTDEVKCISDIYSSFVSKVSTNLGENDLKAGICAAYIEINGN